MDQKSVVQLSMQINNNSANIDPAISGAAIQIQIDSAIVNRTRQVEQQQGDAIVQLIEDAAAITEQLAKGHIDVKL